jgi:TPR repeat protein
MLEMGDGTAPDFTAAAQWYHEALRRSSDRRRPEIADRLLNLYFTGRVSPKSTEDLKNWIQESAGFFSPHAKFQVGSLYQRGLLATNLALAIDWFSKAAGQDDPDAQNSLGELWRSGLGGEKDEAEAVKWFEKAAKKGLPEACVNLAVAYSNAAGVPENKVAAWAWFNFALSRGNKRSAQYRDEVERRLTSDELVQAKDLSNNLLAKLPQMPVAN